jgi:hypothetical protein
MQGRARIETARERDADVLAGGKTLKDVTHVQMIRARAPG